MKSTGATILIADDDATLANTLTHHLTEEGYNALMATDGEVAVKLLKSRNDIRLVVLDLKMPKIDGFEVLKFVKRTHPSTKVIVITGYANLTNAKICRDMGADDVVEKPYELADLFSAIHYTLNK